MRAPLELMLALMAEDEGIGPVARAVPDLAWAGGVLQRKPANEWCPQRTAGRPTCDGLRR